MSFSFAGGFSDGALTPTRALATGLFIAGVVIIGLWTYGSIRHWLMPEPHVAPACYGAEGTNHTAGRAPAPYNPADRDHALWWGEHSRHNIERVNTAELACTAKSCDRKAWAQYRSDMFWYLADRMQRTRQLDATYGDAGLRRARELFGNKADIEIEQGLRARYKAGIFRIKDLKEQQDAYSILIFAGDAALRPCRRASTAK
jgi:hypothetical protein